MVLFTCRTFKNAANAPTYTTGMQSQIQKANIWLPGDKGGGTNGKTKTDVYILLWRK